MTTVLQNGITTLNKGELYEVQAGTSIMGTNNIAPIFYRPKGDGSYEPTVFNTHFFKNGSLSCNVPTVLKAEAVMDIEVVGGIQ